MYLSTYDKDTKDINIRPNGYGYYSRDSDDFHFLDRRNAVKFKKLLIDALDGKNNFGCSNTYVKFDTLKDHIKTALDKVSNDKNIVDCPIDSSIYDDLVNNMRNMSLNKLYKD